MSTFLSIVVVIGFIFALVFVVLFARRERFGDKSKALGWWRSPAGRLIMADSLVLAMLYLSGVLNRVVPQWSLSDEFRVFLTLFAVTVVVWRLIFLIRVRTDKKESTK